MSYSALWAKTTLTKTLVNNDFDKYGQLLKWKRGKETVLEVGFADGSITRDILYKRYGDRMKKLVAIDKLDGMTEYAKSLNKCKNIDFVTMDIMDQRNIKKMKNCFDRIFTFYSIHWIPDNRTLMKNFYKVLKSNGKIFFTIMLSTPFHESFRRLSKHGVWAKYAPIEEVFPEYTDDPVKYVSKIVEDAGFKVDLCKRTQGFDIVEDMPGDIKVRKSESPATEINVKHQVRDIITITIHKSKIETLDNRSITTAMGYASLWTKTTTTKHIATNYLQRYGHLLKWKDYKEMVMEVGCAEGSITKEILFPYIKNHVEKLVAIDKLDNMINCAKKGNVAKEIDFVVMDVMDKEGVKKKINQFDHIFSTMVAHWIPDNRAYITNLRQMLKPDGQLFHTQLTNKHIMTRSFEKQFKEGKWLKYVPNEPVFCDYTDEPMEYVRKLFHEVGFNVQICEVKEEVSVVENFRDFLRPLLHIYQYLDRIPNEKREDFFQYHINNCRDICVYKGEPDVYEMRLQTLICVASKI